VADLQDLKANPKRSAVGVVLEASTDRHRGVTATVLVQTGTLHVGDVIMAGLVWGKIKAMTDENGKRVKEAGPSQPVAVLGLSEVPPAGERFVTLPDEKAARAETEARRREIEAAGMTSSGGVTLDSLFGEIHRGTVRDFNIVLKTDVQGSIEPLVRALEGLGVEGINVKVIHASAGTINESDVNLAVASKGIVIGFNTDPEPGARRHAEVEKVEIREYRVIYDIIDDVERAVNGLLEPIYREDEDSRMEVRQVFRVARRNAIAGCYVREGTVRRNSLARVFRKGEQIAQGRLDSLKRFAEDAREVATGMECGVQIDGFVDFEEGDEIVTYHMEQVR
jgi:translation initiation factor IF-2